MTSFLYDNVKSRSTIPHNNLFEGIERFHLIWFDFHFIWFFNLFECQQIRFSGTPCKPPGSRSQCYLLRRNRSCYINILIIEAKSMCVERINWTVKDVNRCDWSCQLLQKENEKKALIMLIFGSDFASN